MRTHRIGRCQPTAPLLANVLPPTARHCRLDGDPGRDRWRQHRLPVFGALGIEDVGRRHRDHAHSALSLIAAAALTARSTSEPVAMMIASGVRRAVPQHVSAAGDGGDLRRRCAPCAAGPDAKGSGWSGPSFAPPRLPGHCGLHASQGRHTDMRGIMRRVGDLLHRLMGGPSSPRPMESWV